tara:strand:- start:649 stop:1428 length:780 start_codon:yes stop_codon:yes gene_type:complete
VPLYSSPRHQAHSHAPSSAPASSHASVVALDMVAGGEADNTQLRNRRSKRAAAMAASSDLPNLSALAAAPRATQQLVGGYGSRGKFAKPRLEVKLEPEGVLFEFFVMDAAAVAEDFEYPRTLERWESVEAAMRHAGDFVQRLATGLREDDGIPEALYELEDTRVTTGDGATAPPSGVANYALIAKNSKFLLDIKYYTEDEEGNPIESYDYDAALGALREYIRRRAAPEVAAGRFVLTFSDEDYQEDELAFLDRAERNGF